MAECVLCNNTGKVAGSFCICTAGEVQKRVAKGAAKAEELKEKEQKERRARIKKTEQVEQLELIPDEPKRQRDPFELYDWVEIIKPGAHKGIVCLVEEVQAHNKRVYIKGKGITGWAYYTDIKLAPISKKDEKDIKTLIELALATVDKAWFDELIGELIAVK